MKTDFRTTNFPFIYPFKTAHGQKTHQAGFIVQLRSHGETGYGEVSAIDYYDVGIEDLTQNFLKFKPEIENYNYDNPYEFHKFLIEILPNKEFLIAALDIASWDLYGKIKNNPIHKFWHPSQNINLKTDYTIGIDSVNNMISKMKANPYPIYKVKLGTIEDLEIIKCLRENTDSIIRIDANAAWSLKDALKIIPELHKLNIELVEQPLAKNAWQEMKILKKESSIPLIADESCVLESEVALCAEGFHGINIKLSKCGGITPALRMIENAKKSNLKIMMGCMNENIIGSAAILQFANFLDYLDADGPLLQSKVNAKGLKYDYGSMKLSQNNGLGIEILEGIF